MKIRLLVIVTFVNINLSAHWFADEQILPRHTSTRTELSTHHAVSQKAKFNRFAKKNLLIACGVFFVPRTVSLLTGSMKSTSGSGLLSNLCSRLQEWTSNFEYYNATDAYGLLCMFCWLYRDKLLQLFRPEFYQSQHSTNLT